MRRSRPRRASPQALARQALADPQVVGVQSYAGTSSPYTFNGLVRHYFLRQSPSLADLQVQLDAERRPVGTEPRDREAPPHVASNRWPPRSGRRIQVVEVPPGPPVLQTLVAEVYGPDPAARLALARQVRSTFASTPGVVDVDWYVESARPTWNLEVDSEKAAAAGLSAADVASLVRLAGAGHAAGQLHDPNAREDVPVVLRLPRDSRSSLDVLGAMHLHGRSVVAVGELARPAAGLDEPSVYHKNLQPVTYVTGDVAGQAESPVYAILRMNTALAVDARADRLRRSRSSTRISRSTARRTR